MWNTSELDVMRERVKKARDHVDECRARRFPDSVIQHELGYLIKLERKLDALLEEGMS